MEENITENQEVLGLYRESPKENKNKLQKTNDRMDRNY
jgi:hypothetical protein